MEICSTMHKVAIHFYLWLRLALGHVIETNRADVDLCHIMQAPTSRACRGITATQQNINKFLHLCGHGSY